MFSLAFKCKLNLQKIKVVLCLCTVVLAVRLGRCKLACPSTIHGRSDLLTRAKIEIFASFGI